MNPKSTISLMMTVILALLLVTAAQADVYAPQAPAPAYVELDAVQLDQLVAPIALDPDALVAQILTSATYPDQVSDADSWLDQHMNLPPDQRASQANNMSWDPAVKGLIEFPAVLDMMAKNTAWTAQLGNAYYNQPGDVMNAIQAMRLQAQQANVLVTTVHERVVVEAGLVEIVPVDPAVIYVPYYNPWRIWGSLFVAYPGFFVPPAPVGVVWAGGIGFDPGISVGIYEGFGWGFGAWAPVWDGGVVAFGGNTYISNSTTVINNGYFGGHDRGVFEHEGRGVPHGYHPCAHAGVARSRAASARAHAGRSGYGKPSAGRPSAHNRGMNPGHSPYGSRGTGASRGTTAANHGTANRGGMNRGGVNHGTTAANRGSSPSRGASTRASANRPQASRTAANHASSNHPSYNHGSTAANRSASPNRGMSNANRGTSAANRGSATANRSGTNRSAANRSTPNRGTTAANRGANSSRGSANANRSASANRGSSMGNRSSASANRGSSTANRSASAANRGSSMGNRGVSATGRNRGAMGGGNHSSAMASRGSSPAGHSGGNGGGHASGSHGHGR